MWCCTILLANATAQNLAGTGVLRTSGDENWYLFPGSLFQDRNINDQNFETEPIHNIYTVKAADGEIRRVHYAVDEHGLRANIHSNAAGFTPNKETNSIQSEQGRWPSDDFELALEKFISLRQAEQTPVYPRHSEKVFPKPSIPFNNVSKGMQNQVIKFASSNANLPSLISSKRLFTKFIPIYGQQIPSIGKTLRDEISNTNKAEKESMLKYQAPPVVSSSSYAPSSKISVPNGYFESQRIPKPITVPHYQSSSSVDNFLDNGPIDLTKNFTDIPITKTTEYKDISQSEVLKSPSNIKILQTFSNQAEKEELETFHKTQNKSPLSEVPNNFNQVIFSNVLPQRNENKPEPFMNNSFSTMAKKTQNQPNFNNTFSSVSFESAPLSTIFDSNNDEGGPHYYYVMNVGNNSGDSVSKLIEKYFKTNNTNEILNEDSDNILSESNQEVTKSGNESHSLNNIINRELKLSEGALVQNRINSSFAFSKDISQGSLDSVDSEQHERKSEKPSVEEILGENDINNMLKTVDGEIMLTANNQEIMPSSHSNNKIISINDGLGTILPQLVVDEEIINLQYTDNISNNQATQRHNNSDPTIVNLSEILSNTSRNITNSDITDFSNLKLNNRNPRIQEINSYIISDKALASDPVFPESIQSNLNIIGLDEYIGNLPNSQNKEGHAILTNVTENSSFDEMISNAEAAHVSSLDSLSKNEENKLAKPKIYYSDKNVTRIMAKLNYLEQSEDVTAHNDIKVLDTNQKEEPNLNLLMTHPLLELMIPKAKMNDFMMKINNTPVIIRILHPEFLTTDTIPQIFRIQDAEGNFSNEVFISNFSLNISGNSSIIFDSSQPNSLEYRNDSTSDLFSKIAEIDSLNNAIDQKVKSLAAVNENSTNFSSEILNSDLLNENNMPLFHESENIAKMDFSFADPDTEESRVFEFPSRGQYNTKEPIDINLLENFKTSETNKNETGNSNANKFYAYVANVIHENAFPEKNKYKPKTKFQPIDINEFYKLIYESQPNNVPNGFEIVKNIAKTINAESFMFPKSGLKDFLKAKGMNDVNSVPNKDSENLPSSIQYAFSVDVRINGKFSELIPIWCGLFLVLIAKAENVEEIELFKSKTKDRNWYRFPDNWLQNADINEVNAEIEPTHDIYTVKAADGEIRRVHYAVDEHGLRANIHSNAAGFRPNIETNSIQLEQNRWPSDDFDFSLEKFISMRQKEYTPVFTNLDQMLFSKPLILSSDVNKDGQYQETKFKPVKFNLPTSISSNRLFSKLMPTYSQQFPPTRDSHTFPHTLDEETSHTNRAGKEVMNYQSPSRVTSPNYIPSSKNEASSVSFESQRILRPIIPFQNNPTLSSERFSNNDSVYVAKYSTHIPITRVDDKNISQPEILKFPQNLEIFPNLQTVTNQTENENITFHKASNESPVSEAVIPFTKTVHNGVFTFSNVSKPNTFKLSSNDSVSAIVMPHSNEPKFNNMIPTISFESAPLSTIFDSNSYERGPYYQYLINPGKNSVDIGSKLIDQVFKSIKTNELLNEERENHIITEYNKKRAKSDNKSYTFNIITDNETKLNENINVPNEINSTTLLSKNSFQESLDSIDSKENSDKMQEMISVGNIPNENENNGTLNAVKEDIMLIANYQDVPSLPFATNMVKYIQDDAETIPIQSVEFEEIVNDPSMHNNSSSQTLKIFENPIEEHIGNDSGVGILTEILNKPSKSTNVETADFPTLEIRDKNPTIYENQSSELSDEKLISRPASMKNYFNGETIPETIYLDQNSEILLNHRNKARNMMLTAATENPLSGELNPNVNSIQSSSSNILSNTNENISIESNKHYPDKYVIKIMAKINFLSPVDEVIGHDGIKILN
ncbi:hypothetical protein HNY73_009567 [Argiope bruennichi]|uniref:Uncharacterized protein n=1 Tax=Argiope bruennichi TaxID=94029 RepID=A0A8T0FF32_ARGBR|nr:hypothetical protein HNY73_009567 [Argiope bruennichi]